MRVTLLSLEPWDDVWRRNQHLTVQLVGQQLVSSVVFVEPARLGQSRTLTREVADSITVVTPPLVLPKRIGGMRGTATILRRGPLADTDVLWVNDPVLGALCAKLEQPSLYDVTDDWRTFDFPPRIRRRIVSAEGLLAERSRTVVCSIELRRRWRDRYGVQAAIVHNGVDPRAWALAGPRALVGASPHVGYIGTLHEHRLDIPLLLSLAGDSRVGTVHLVGPDALSEGARAALASAPGVILHGAVPSSEVPTWSLSMDVLISPHLVNDFTRSLDAIKGYEYLASGRPVVATPTSGFDRLRSDTLLVTDRAGFVDAVASRAPAAGPRTDSGETSWAVRAREFAAELSGALGGRKPARLHPGQRGRP